MNEEFVLDFYDANFCLNRKKETEVHFIRMFCFFEQTDRNSFVACKDFPNPRTYAVELMMTQDYERKLSLQHSAVLEPARQCK